MEIVAIVILYMILFILDGYPIIRKYKKGKPLLYCVLFFSAFSLNILFSLKVHIPSPAQWIKRLILFMIRE